MAIGAWRGLSFPPNVPRMIRNVLAVVAGVVVAGIVMMACEFANSRLYPFPEGMDVNDIEQVRSFAAAMPLSALVLVAIGWTVGSFAGGFVTTRIAQSVSPGPAQITGLILTALGGVNAWMIQNPAWFHWGALPVFLGFALIGHHVARRS
jgi:hypothetical protein